MTDSLITITPTTRSKGFKSKNVRFTARNSDDYIVANDIAAALKTIKGNLYATKDYKLLKIIRNSYDRFLSNQPLEPDDFILAGHEILEYQNVDKCHHLRYLIYRYKYNKYPELKIVDDFPPCLQIEPTSVCNYRCVMCYQSDQNFVKKSGGFMGNMTYKIFVDIIDEVTGKIEAITLASRGEPLLHTKIIPMLEYCRGKFLALKLNTNASILDEPIINALLSSDLQTLVFSIDAADKQSYEKIRVGGKFDKILRNIELFREIRERDYPDSKTLVRISGVKINDKQDIEQMEKFWGQFSDVVAFTNYNPWQTAYRNPENSIKSACTEFWRRMFIWWDGKANPCDYDYKSTLSKWQFGRQSVSDIWTSEEYNDYREVHLNGMRANIEPCRRCVLI